MKYERTVFENDTIVNAAEVLNKFDAALHELYAEVNGHTVWENESPTTAFAAQSIVIEPEKVPTHYEVQFMRTTSAQYMSTTGKIPIANHADLTANGGAARYRAVKVTQDSEAGTITFAFTTGYSGTTAGTGHCIPVAIKLYYV